MNKLTHIKQSDHGVDDELFRIVSTLNTLIDKIADPSTATPKDTGKVSIQAVTVGNNEYSLSMRTQDGVINSIPGMFIKADMVHNSNSPKFNYTAGVNAITTVQTDLGLVTTVQGALVIAEEARENAWGGPVATTLAMVDSTASTKLAGIAAGATVGATWGTDVNSIPARISGLNLPTPCVAITENFIGFYQSGTVTDVANWPVAIYNDSGVGKFYLKDTVGGNTTLISAGTTAFACGPTAAPTVTITQAGVLTAIGTLRTGASGKRIEIANSHDIWFYKADGDTQAQIYMASTTVFTINVSTTAEFTASNNLTLSSSANLILNGNTGIYFNSSVITDINLTSGHQYKINGTVLTYSDVGAAASSHEHAGTAITSGEVGYAYLPTGLTANHVCPGINGIAPGTKVESSVYASKTSSGATDDRLKTLPVDIGGSTYYLLIDEWV